MYILKYTNIVRYTNLVYCSMWVYINSSMKYSKEYLSLICENEEISPSPKKRISHYVPDWMKDPDKVYRQVVFTLEQWVMQLHNPYRTDSARRNSAITIPNLRNNIMESQPIGYWEKRTLDRTILKVLNKLVSENILERATILGGPGQSIEVQGWKFTDDYDKMMNG